MQTLEAEGNCLRGLAPCHGITPSHSCIRKAETADRQGLGNRGAARRRKHLLSGLLNCGKYGGSLTVAGHGDRKRYYCSNAKEKGPSICTGMPGLLKLQAEDLIL